VSFLEVCHSSNPTVFSGLSKIEQCGIGLGSSPKAKAHAWMQCEVECESTRVTTDLAGTGQLDFFTANAGISLSRQVSTIAQTVVILSC
jgi:hypothetical protein